MILIGLILMLIDLNRLLAIGEIDNADGRLEHRLISIRKVVELLDQSQPKVMIETGCQSSAMLFAKGMSTCIFGALAKKYNTILYTIDNNLENIEKCKKYSKEYSKYIRYINGNSWDVLKGFDKEIDFLYLDSYDFFPGIEEESRLHQLKEIEIAYPYLSDNSIVLLDDANVQMWFEYRLNDIDIEGKTYYSHRFLMENNAKCIIDFPNSQRLYIIRK